MELLGLFLGLDLVAGRRIVTPVGVGTIGMQLGGIGLGGVRVGSARLVTQEGVKRSLGEDHGTGIDDVVGVELVDGEHVGLGEVAHRQPRGDVGTVQDDENLVEFGDAAQGSLGALGGRHVADHQRVDDDDPAVASPIGQRAAQSGGNHLLGRALSVGTRLRSVNGATSGPLRGADGALTSSSGTLLTPRLLATTGNRTTSLGGVGPLTGGSELRDDDLMDQRNVGVDVKDLTGKVDRAGLGTLGVDDVDGLGLVHAASPFLAAFLAALRTTTSEPFGPGTAPRTRMSPRSASTE